MFTLLSLFSQVVTHCNYSYIMPESKLKRDLPQGSGKGPPSISGHDYLTSRTIKGELLVAEQWFLCNKKQSDAHKMLMADLDQGCS